MNNAALAWIFFYIAVGILGIFLTLIYIAHKLSTSKRR